MKRRAPGYALAKGFAEEPGFGKIIEHEAKFSNWPYSRLWGLGSAPLSFLIGQVIYHFDLMRHLVVDVAEAQAKLSHVDETRFAFSVILGFEGGATAVMNANSRERWGTEI
ncbi:MAG: hypothetical protein JTT11_02410 [Candidatus Brockarchaeota archaeon]|nr:hypothetical protein [Candidatus Brockarchaeota archaeon]